VAEALNPLPQRLFAATGKSVSVLGLGTVKFGRNQGVKYPGGDGFVLPTDGEISNILDLCLDNGINLIDTAPAYGTAEERLGKLMGSRRDKLFIVGKTGEEFANAKSTHNFSAAHTRMSVEHSLRRLKTDHLDCVLVHANHDDLNVIDHTDVVTTLLRLKEEGKLLSIGVSVYTLEGGRRAVDLTDAVMVAYNRNYAAERATIDYALERGKAVLVKKALASGHLDAVGGLEENIRFVLDTPGVTSLLFGSITPANILANIQAAGDIRAVNLPSAA
jgi:aryl-alcohol dehydrogenase-like predicted oxidoreductase